MCSSLLSIWRFDSLIKRKTALKKSPQYKTCPNGPDLPGPDPSGACSGCGRRTLTVSRSISRTFIPGPLFSIILVTYCFTASVTFMVATQKSQRQEEEHREPTTGGALAKTSWADATKTSLRVYFRVSDVTGASASRGHPGTDFSPFNPRINSWKSSIFGCALLK